MLTFFRIIRDQLWPKLNGGRQVNASPAGSGASGVEAATGGQMDGGLFVRAPFQHAPAVLTHILGSRLIPP